MTLFGNSRAGADSESGAEGGGELVNYPFPPSDSGPFYESQPSQ